MPNIIRPVKGTRDYYPEEMAIRTWLYEKIRKISESFGYQEFEGPLIETLELYAAKSGEELVKEQSFVFPDRGGNLIALRPELTPTLARMVAQRQKQLIYPLRWWSFGPMWRYEQPQRGRTREFFQWNIDLIGVDAPEADAELIAIAASFLREVGLQPDTVAIFVNSRKLMDQELGALGVPRDKRPEVFRLIDRRARLDTDNWKASVGALGIQPGQLEELLRLLGDPDLWKKSEDLSRVFSALEALGVRDYVRYAPDIVRGLDYYTGTVFESYDCERKERAILAGGRYDSLVADVGGEPLPAVGYAMGDKVLRLLLEKHGLLPDFDGSFPALIFQTVFDMDHLPNSYTLASELRLAGFKVVCYPTPARLAKQFRYADRIGARVALVLGPDELSRSQVTIKDLRTGEQRSVARDELVSALDHILAQE